MTPPLPEDGRGTAALDESLRREVADPADGDVLQTAADLDQTHSDLDQTLSDGDQGTSDDDQDLADREQHAADRDQCAADRDDEDEQGVHDETRAERKATSRERTTTAAERAHTTAERLGAALRRDEVAQARDQSADARDRAADARDRRAEAEGTLTAAAVALQGARASVARVRHRSAREREASAKDRRDAAQDRRRAAADRAHAGYDELTGVFRRGTGELALAHEISRARRTGRPLVLAMIDVDGLKAVNDRLGHAGGDALLRDVPRAIVTTLRAYDITVRWGGDEFVCALSDVSEQVAAERLEGVAAALQVLRPGASISAGLAGLEHDDTLETLVARADAALYRRKAERRVG